MTEDVLSVYDNERLVSKYDKQNLIGESEDGSLYYYIKEVEKLREHISALKEEVQRLRWTLEQQD